MMKKLLLLLFAGLLLSGQSLFAQATDLFFSEYIEGSSNNKALEIYNGTGADVDLTGYAVKLGSNGADWGNTLDLTGTLIAGDVFVIYNSAADQLIIDEGDASSNVTYFNGDDAVGLFKSGVLIDVIGAQGEDPGSAWDVAGVTEATGEHTLVR
jgi:predicted extracellular nuclease